MCAKQKTCTICGELKNLDEFYKHPRMADGFLNQCKPCIKQYVKKRRYGESREKILQYDRERAKSEKRIAHAKKTIQRWKLNFPKRRAAQIALGNAVRDGRVKKLPCFVCGEKAEAHHPDYDRPLDVVWLCPHHHKQTHAMGEIKEAA